MLETLLSIALLINATSTVNIDCSKIASTTSCAVVSAPTSTPIALSATVPLEKQIVYVDRIIHATTTVYATTTVEKIVYRRATSTPWCKDWCRSTTTPSEIRYIEKLVYVPVYQCPVRPATTTPPVHYSTTTPDYTKPPKIEKIEAKIEKQIEKIEERQERMIDRMNNMFERMIDRLNEMLGNI